MKKNRIFVAGGALVLAVGSFIVTKANIKRALIPSLYYQKSATVCATISNTSVFTTTGTGSTITFRTSSAGTAVSVFTHISADLKTCSNAVSVYLKH